MNVVTTNASLTVADVDTSSRFYPKGPSFPVDEIRESQRADPRRRPILVALCPSTPVPVIDDMVLTAAIPPPAESGEWGVLTTSMVLIGAGAGTGPTMPAATTALIGAVQDRFALVNGA
ncbi:hypothetical protein [Streptomyces sp. NPDC096339]|uniref:hypothetical protein n=1 Tax=Streptomyces sp. NPDC096339 TaxID=3366086 RepID=UPI0037F74B95